MAVVGLQDYSGRYSSRLSGGQQQRVALARALVARPDVLLLDEPLSNLDAALRTQMRTELRRLQREVGITTVLVTHDQHEALAMSDRIAMISAGQVQEIGTPRDLYERPASMFAACFLGNANQIPGTLAAGSDTVESDLGPLRAKHLPAAGKVTCFIRPECIAWHETQQSPSVNSFEGTVAAIRYVGEYCECDVAVKGVNGDILLQVRAPIEQRIDIGDTCRIGFSADAVNVIAA